PRGQPGAGRGGGRKAQPRRAEPSLLRWAESGRPGPRDRGHPADRQLKVLVTGGAGYLGSVLVPRLLRGGHEVRALDSLMYDGSSLLPVWSDPAFEFVKGDVRRQDVMRGALSGVDAVVHL